MMITEEEWRGLKREIQSLAKKHRRELYTVALLGYGIGIAVGLLIASVWFGVRSHG